MKNAIDVLRTTERVAEGHDIAIVPADEVSSLPALIIAPLDPVRLGAANRALERAAIPWRFGARRAGESTVRGAALDGVSTSLRYDLVAQTGAVAETLAVVGRDAWVVAGPRYVHRRVADHAGRDEPARSRRVRAVARRRAHDAAGGRAGAGDRCGARRAAPASAMGRRRREGRRPADTADGVARSADAKRCVVSHARRTARRRRRRQRAAGGIGPRSLLAGRVARSPPVGTHARRAERVVVGHDGISRGGSPVAARAGTDHRAALLVVEAIAIGARGGRSA